MTTEQELKEKLRKIEALFAGASTHGEREAAREDFAFRAEAGNDDAAEKRDER